MSWDDGPFELSGESQSSTLVFGVLKTWWMGVKRKKMGLVLSDVYESEFCVRCRNVGFYVGRVVYARLEERWGSVRYGKVGFVMVEKRLQVLST